MDKRLEEERRDFKQQPIERAVAFTQMRTRNGKHLCSRTSSSCFIVTSVAAVLHLTHMGVCLCRHACTTGRCVR